MTIDIESKFGDTTGTMPDPGPQIVEEIGYEMFLLDDGRVTIEGFAVPFVHVDTMELSDENQYRYWPMIDNRIVFPVKDREELCQVVGFGAMLAAVAAGFSNFGANMRPLNSPFSDLVHGLGSQFSSFKVKQFLEKQGGSVFGNTATALYEGL